jgi:transposase
LNSILDSLSDTAKTTVWRWQERLSHKHPKVRAWLSRYPRWTFHFTPTSASWLNGVEGFFARLTKRPLKRGVFRSIVEPQAAINRFRADPRPFHWTKDPDTIIAAVKRSNEGTKCHILPTRPMGLA